VSELFAVIEAAAVEAGTTRHERGEAIDYEVGDVVVASVGPAGAEFRLGSDIAAAALNTPDTQTSARGAEWVSFRPRTVDRFARDRAEAWTALAVKVSLRPPRRPSPPASPAR
jgi:hypothetical protein